MTVPSPQHTLPELTPATSCLLLQLTRRAISHALGLSESSAPAPAPERHPQWLTQLGACHVTLELGSQLRGRFGSLVAYRSWHDDLIANACTAATNDPRHPPLNIAEWAQTRIRIDLLSPLEAVTFHDEQDVINQLRPGVDGLSFRYGYHSSHLLPHTWAEYPDPAEFLYHLKQRSGLPPDFWDREVILHRHSVLTCQEAAADEPAPAA